MNGDDFFWSRLPSRRRFRKKIDLELVIQFLTQSAIMRINVANDGGWWIA